MKFALQCHSDLRLLISGIAKDGDEIRFFF